MSFKTGMALNRKIWRFVIKGSCEKFFKQADNRPNYHHQPFEQFS